jgi:hypothetical protein
MFRWLRRHSASHSQSIGNCNDQSVLACVVECFACGLPAYAVLMGGMKERERPFQLAPGPWPETPSDDPVAELARRFSLNLAAAIGDSSLRSVSRATGVAHNTLANILAGRIWPDFSTIARLEIGLAARLWPSTIKNQ